MKKEWNSAKLSQSACMLEALAATFNRTAGNFCIIIHSYMDCANVFSRCRERNGARTYEPGRFFCTNLSETDVITGATIEKLTECIELVAETRTPEIIYVFASCLSEMIGDDIEAAVAEAQRKTSVPVAAITSSGLDDLHPKEVLNKHAFLISRTFKPAARVSSSSVNIIGFPEDNGEIAGLLKRIGIEVNVWIGDASPLSEWQKLPEGGLNVVVAAEMYRSLLETMRDEYGIGWVESVVPVGFKQTDSFLLDIARSLGVEDTAHEAIAEARNSCMKTAAALMKKTRNLHAAYNVGTSRQYLSHIIARDGLGDALFFKEIGCSLTLVIQGSPDPERRRLIARQLKDMRINAGFEIFVDLVSMTKLMKKRRFDFIYCPLFLTEMVQPSGAPLIPFGALRMGYDGAVSNLKLIEGALKSRRA